ncbi:MAG: hypothetical protein ACYDBA_09725 [Sulfuricaulis sp.]
MSSKHRLASGMTKDRTASRCARTVQEAELEGGAPRALGALPELTQRCATCHTSYRPR